MSYDLSLSRRAGFVLFRTTGDSLLGGKASLSLFFSTFQLHEHLCLLHGASLAKHIFLLILFSKNTNRNTVTSTDSILIIRALVSIDNSKVNNFCSNSRLTSARNKQEHEKHTVRYKLLNQRPKTIETGGCSKSIHAGGAMVLPRKMLLFAHPADRGGFDERGSVQT